MNSSTTTPQNSTPLSGFQWFLRTVLIIGLTYIFLMLAYGAAVAYVFVQTESDPAQYNFLEKLSAERRAAFDRGDLPPSEMFEAMEKVFPAMQREVARHPWWIILPLLNFGIFGLLGLMVGALRVSSLAGIFPLIAIWPSYSTMASVLMESVPSYKLIAIVSIALQFIAIYLAARFVERRRSLKATVKSLTSEPHV